MTERRRPTLALGRTCCSVVFAHALLGCDAPNDIVASEVGGAGSGGTVAGSGAAAGGASSSGGASSVLELSGDLETHDSTVLEAEGRYYLMHTGPGIQMKTSRDLLTWTSEGRVLETLPDWIGQRLPDVTDLWAPDLSYVNGVYHLYYAASTFGSGQSCIGHATKTALDAPEPWVDAGSVICSDQGGAADDWDAIDPATFSDPDGVRWMVFGSYGSGIKLIRLNAEGAREGDEFYALAERPVDVAMQAPFAFEGSGYYYLFVSFDRCCQGTSSTNNIRVGRATTVEGPYLDRDGVPMLEGGGTLVLEGNQRWRGVGANTILSTAGRTYNVYHSYDANAAGRATLRIAEIAWDAEGWPVSAGP